MERYNKMYNYIRIVCFYLACLMAITACWIGFEYMLEGEIHSSEVDGIVAIILSWFITDKYVM